MMSDVVVIGAGAAGCFAAIELKRLCPEAKVLMLEKGRKALAKVAITGGGRCNLTNSFAEVRSLETVYPRGFRLMKKLLHHFSQEDTCRWFEQQGVRLVTQEDQCVFPLSQDAMEIVNVLMRELHRRGVEVRNDTRVERIIPMDDGFRILTGKGEEWARKVLVTAGGQPAGSGYAMLEGLDVEIVPSLPSLFSFCVDDTSLKQLTGTVVKEAQVFLPGTKLKASGPLLVTHWGLSGPAVLKLSSYAARLLAEQNYTGDMAVRWLADDQESICAMLEEMASVHREKKITSIYPTAFNARLWGHLLQRAALPDRLRWKELKGRDFNRLVNTLTNDTYRMTGKNRFREEFVTSGGVALSGLNAGTLEAKKIPGMYFAGEITDVDAITGGFNLQAAWTMGWVAAQGLSKAMRPSHSLFLSDFL